MGTAGEKRTPMAWQHRDLNYHNNYSQDRYHTGVEMNSMRNPGPPSTSDRLSHRTDKSWRTQRDSNLGYNVGNATPVYQGQSGSGAYPPSRPSYSSGRPTSRPQSPDSSSTSSSSTSSSQDTERGGVMMGPHPGEMGVYGYEGYYPGYVQGAPMPAGPGYPPSMTHGMYPGCTLKSAKSVPSLAVGTWDGEPCPVHGIGPMSLQGPPLQGPPMMMPMPLRPQRRSASIYDMRMCPQPPPIYGTIPHRHPPPPTLPGDRRSLVGVPALGAPHHPHPMRIPPQLLPPMVRPRPLVVSEEGATEPLPVRAPQEKGSIPMKATDGVDGKGDRVCSKDGICVLWIVLSVVATGLVLGLLLVFIL